MNLTVAAVNDAPVITGPTGPLAATLGNPFAFTGGNALDLTDVDGGSGEFTVTLLVSKGTLTLGTLAGLTFDIGDGTADNAMQFRGTLADIRAALATLTYTASAAGSATLSLIIDDNGNTGSGGSRSASHAVAFNNS